MICLDIIIIINFLLIWIKWSLRTNSLKIIIKIISLRYLRVILLNIQILLIWNQNIFYLWLLLLNHIICEIWLNIIRIIKIINIIISWLLNNIKILWAWHLLARINYIILWWVLIWIVKYLLILLSITINLTIRRKLIILIFLWLVIPWYIFLLLSLVNLRRILICITSINIISSIWFWLISLSSIYTWWKPKFDFSTIISILWKRSIILPRILLRWVIIIIIISIKISVTLV